MHHNYQKAKYFALTISVAAAMSGIALAQNATDPDQSKPSVNQNYSNPGSSKSMMSQAQQQLKQKGFYTGKVDGINGPKTKMAIRRYQKSNDLTQSGRLDQTTRNSLGLRGERSGEASRSADQSSEGTKTPQNKNTNPNSQRPHQ
jgi:peptidoglycan hydrolase-like protein with peptidoglycan-binding domain